MTAAALELQKAIFSRLKSDSGLVAELGGDKVYDQAPADVAFPYITFGRTSIYDWSTGTEEGSEHLFTLHFWSKGKGKKQAFDLMEIAGARLHDADLPLDGFTLVNLRLEFTDVRFDDDLDLHHGMMRFRAVIEQDV